MKKAGLFIGVITLFHIWLALKFPLAPDEAYYWVWSRWPDWGYYDQGPMVAWCIRAGCLIFGNTEPGVRACVIAASSLTLWYLALTSKRLFPKVSPTLAIAPVAVTPLGVAGGFVATYDPLVILFTAAGIYYAVRVIFDGSKGAVVGLGLAVGLGLLSKHTMILLAPTLLLFLLLSRAYKVWLKRPHLYTALLIGLAVYSPNLVWQSKHGWETYRHLFLLADKGLDHGRIQRFFEFVGSQAALISPLWFIGMVCALVWGWKRWRTEGDDSAGFAWCLAVPVLIIFCFMTIKSKVQANWAITGWLTPGLLYAAWAQAIEPNVKRRKVWLVGPSWAVISCTVLSLLSVMPEARSLVGLKLPARKDQMTKLYGGRESGEAINQARMEMKQEGGDSLPAVGSATYDKASLAAFYTPGQPNTFCLYIQTRMNSYRAWNAASGLREGGNAVVLDAREPDDPELPDYAAVFDRVEVAEPPVQIYRRPLYPDPVNTWHVYRCYGYRPNPHAEQPKGG